MHFIPFRSSGVSLSLVALGGHEFLADGTVKAMGEEFHRAVTPGVIWDGFGGDGRRKLLAAAYRAGINLFDLTMDSEKEAFGRNLRDLPPPYPIYIQTRPEGMAYNNDPSDLDKTRLLDYTLLSAEAQRAARMLGRERIDFYNFGLFPPAVERQPGYVAKLAANVERLKSDGLIRFACADTLSGEAITLQMMETGAFDAVYTNFSVLCDTALRRVIPTAAARGMGVFVREVFAKGRLFSLGGAAGSADRSSLARAAIRWVLAQGVASTLVLGAANADQLTANLAAIEDPAPTGEDPAILDALRGDPAFAKAKVDQDEFFIKGFV